MRPWEAVQDMPPEQARALIEGAAPDLAGVPLELCGAGWDNTAYLVGGVWVFRFPRRPSAAPLIENEVRCLPHVAGRLPLAVPMPERVGAPAQGFPWTFAAYRLLPGEVAAERGLGAAARERAAAPLGRFLAALHGLPASELAALGCPQDEIRRLDVPYRRAKAEESLVELEALGAGAGPSRDEARAIRAALDESAERASAPRADVPVHGDLDARHLLVDGRDQVVGVIDWGDLHRGDAASDLALAHQLLPPAPSPARAAFRAAYGPIDDGVWALARFRALERALRVLAWAAETGRAATAAEARRWVVHALAPLAEGG